MQARLTGRHRSLLHLSRMRRVGPDSSPLAVVAGSTFLLAEVHHNILLAPAHHSILLGVARHPSPDCTVAVGIHTVPAVRTGLLGHYKCHLASAADRARVGFEAMEIQDLLSRTRRRRNGLVEGRRVVAHWAVDTC